MAYEQKDGQGALFIEEGATGNKPVLKGYLSYKGERIPVACWFKTAKSGKQYYSMSVDRRAQERDGVAAEGTVQDDDIRF